MRAERDEIERTGKARPGTVQRKVQPKEKSGTSPLAITNMLLLVVLCGALGFGYFQQETRVTDLKAELDDAIGFISQSKLLIARLEGELNETGEVLEQSGSAAEKKLAFLDSEMRKLWGVSNDRNKKAIADNKESLTQLQADLKAMEKRIALDVAKKLSAIEKAQNSFEASIASLNAQVKTLESTVSLSSSELAITRETVNDSLQKVRGEIKSLSELAQTVETNRKAIAAIDSSRKLLNERVLSLDTKVNALQLEQNKTATP
jgi:chromosome segregation ATPase